MMRVVVLLMVAAGDEIVDLPPEVLEILKAADNTPPPPPPDTGDGACVCETRYLQDTGMCEVTQNNCRPFFVAVCNGFPFCEPCTCQQSKTTTSTNNMNTGPYNPFTTTNNNARPNNPFA